MDQTRVKVSIMGQTYTIKGDASPEYIQEIAEYISAKIDEISAQNLSCNPMQAAILAAMNIADEFFQVKNIRNSDEGQIAKKAQTLISMLDEGLIGDVFSRASIQ